MKGSPVQVRASAYSGFPGVFRADSPVVERPRSARMELWRNFGSSGFRRSLVSVGAADPPPPWSRSLGARLPPSSSVSAVPLDVCWTADCQFFAQGYFSKSGGQFLGAPTAASTACNDIAHCGWRYFGRLPFGATLRACCPGQSEV